MKNRLMLRGIGRGLMWMCAGTLFVTLRIGDIRLQLAACAAGTLLVAIGLLQILSHRPPQVLARLAACCLAAGLLGALAFFATAWPGVDRWFTLFPGPVAGVLGGLFILRAGRLASSEGLTDNGGTLRTLGGVWLVVFGLLPSGMSILAFAGATEALKLNSLPAACGLWAFFAVPCIAGFATAWSLVAATDGISEKCKNCGFSLAGLRERVCPECGLRFEGAAPTAGEELMQPKPMRQWGVAITFVLLAAGGATYFQRPANGLERSKPYWMLRRDLTATLPQPLSSHTITFTTPSRFMTEGAKQAMNEFAARVRNGTLRPDQQHELVELALEAQRDLTVAFDEWTGLVEPMVAAGALNQEQLDRLAKQSFHLIFQTSPRVKVGRPIAMRLEIIDRPSFGSLSHSNDILMAREVLVTIGSNEFWLGRAKQFGTSAGMHGWNYESRALSGTPETPRAPMTPGHHRLEAVVKLDTWDGRTGSYTQLQELRFSADIEVVEDGAAPRFELVRDPSAGEKIRSGLQASIYALSQDESGTLSISASLLQSWECDLVADVIAEVDGIEAVMGTVHISTTSPYAHLEVTPYVMGILSGSSRPVTIRLRPNLEAVWSAIDADKVWAGEEIRIKTEARGRH